jgi:cytochrome c oxidase subunit 1
MATEGGATRFAFEDKISRAALVFAFLMLAVGGLFGVTQLLARTPYAPQFISAKTYYTILTGHGVFLAIVWTAFFIVAFSNYVVTRELGVNLSRTLLGLGAVLAIVGSLVAGLAILFGKAAVLYTFYAPLKAHPAFYLGSAALIIGTWLIGAAYFKAYLQWKRENPSKEIPLGTMGILATWIVWFEATPPLAFMVLKDLVPMALWGKSVDVLEARTYFWYFGHPLVYFWIIPAVTYWYHILPKLAGGRVFSRTMAKVAFILFILASTPVGVHHQFVDPGISNIAKFVHTVFTFIVATPSLLTAFNVLATLEMAGRMRGGKGFLGWLKTLPWRDPAFSAGVLAFIIFGFGGISGVVNASYIVNYIVHNTVWVVGHFHLTVGTAATLTFMGASYLMIPALFGRNLYSQALARAQPFVWFIGMSIFSFSLHTAGLLGVPRRTYNVMYAGNAPDAWIPLLLAAAVGGIIFASSGAVFVFNALASILAGPRVNPHPKPDLAELVDDDGVGPAGPLDRLSVWLLLALALIVFAYAIPFYEIYSTGLSLVPPVTPEGLRLTG